MSQKPRILLIDDSEITVEGLKSYLDQKYEVHTAYNGLDGLNEFENNKNKFDLVITDLIMPLISGTGLITLVKKESPEMPVIAITGWGKHPSELASEAKADVILEKPFELEVLEESISKLLYPNKP